MRMNSANYKQYDTRWASLGYPKKPWYIRNCGCGEVAVANIIIELEKYADYTPKTIQPYCKQFAASNGNGTYFSGIPTMMKHYGLTEVKEHTTMNSLWKELAKGNRVAIYLMGNRKGGSNKVSWTSSAHFVASVGYKYEKSDHWVYMKDSNATSSLRNGWISYKGNLKNDVSRVWSGKLNGALFVAGKLKVDGDGGKATVKRLQQFLGTSQTANIDGVITGQRKANAKYRVALKSVKNGKGGSACVKKLQKWLGLKQDGDWGKDTSIALQKKIGVKADGYFGVGSMKALQKYLNEHDKAVYPSTPVTPVAPTVPLTKPEKAVEYAIKLANDDSYHYVVWKSGDAKTKLCPICHGYTGKYKGFNCIRFVFSCWYHGGGIPCKHEGGLISNAIGDKMYKAKTDAEALKLAQTAIGCNDIKVIRNKSGFANSQLQVGDACMHFENGVYKHIYLYAGDGKMVDCGNWSNTAKQIAVRARQTCQIVVRYTGK